MSLFSTKTTVPTVVKFKGVDGEEPKLFKSFKNNDEQEMLGFLIQQTVTTRNKTGFPETKKYSVFISDLKEIIEAEGIVEGKEFPGTKICREEAYAPFNKRNNPKVYPANNEKAGQLVLKNGKPVFMQDYLTEKLDTPPYMFLEHDEAFINKAISELVDPIPGYTVETIPTVDNNGFGSTTL